MRECRLPRFPRPAFSFPEIPENSPTDCSTAIEVLSKVLRFSITLYREHLLFTTRRSLRNSEHERFKSLRSYAANG